MNLLIFEESDFIAANERAGRQVGVNHYSPSSKIYVGPAKTQHLRTVLKADIGSKIKIGQLNGKIGTGEIKSFTNNNTIIEIKELTQESVQPEFDLVLALPRPQMLKRILENITTLGVRRLYLINSKRVEKSFFSSPVLKPENLKKHLILGLEQAAVTIMPEVEIYSRFRDFETHILSGRLNDGTKIIAHMDGSTNLAEIALRQKENITTVAIGPEGGWQDFEVERFEHYGFTRISLGPRILRVETAVYVLLAQCAAVGANYYSPGAGWRGE